VNRRAWGIDDPLHRGDDADGVRTPEPSADPSLVRHILGLDGIGRSTPYTSTSEDEETAQFFAGRDGRVWHTLLARIEEEKGLRYISIGELRDLLRGKGKGDAAWHSAFEVRQAFKFVEEHAEHLIDFRPLEGQTPESVAAVVSRIFSRERP